MLHVWCMRRILALLSEMTTAHFLLLSAVYKVGCRSELHLAKTESKRLKNESTKYRLKGEKKKDTTFKNFINLLQPRPLKTIKTELVYCSQEKPSVE